MKLSESTILVVDDEPQLRKGYAAWLRRAGCPRIFTAANGLEALEIFLAEEIDVLVSDVRMPVLDGVGLLHRISGSGKPVPSVIFVSGFSTLELPVAYSLGVEAFLGKPFSAATLTGAVSSTLAAREDLWAVPLPKEPVAQVVVEAAAPAPPHIADSSLHFGRGGFSCPVAQPIPLVPLSFSLRLHTVEHPIRGQGHVRWFSQERQRAGIEFHYLVPASRPTALEQIAARRNNSFIPL